MTSNISSAGKIPTEEVLDLSPPNAEIKEKSDSSAMITALQATMSSDSTATRTAPLAGETTDSSVEIQSTDVEVDMDGIGLNGTTTECSEDVATITVAAEIVKCGGLWLTPDADRASTPSDAVSADLMFLTVQP